jgi:hypothetical protein
MDELRGIDVVGFDVLAADGPAGKVRDADEDYLVVKPGMLHAKHEIPVGMVQTVDPSHHRVVVRCTKREILHAPRPVPFLPDGTWSHIDRFRGY